MRVELALLALVCACDAVPADPVIDPPRNDCGTCAEGQCNDKGFCEVAEAIDYYTVLAMPDSVNYAPNVTYLLSPAERLAATTQEEECADDCVTLPRFAAVQGYYVVSQDAAHTVGVELLDAAGGALTQAQIPMRAHYTRLVEVEQRMIAAADVGLPVDPVLGRRLYVSSEPPVPGFGGSVGLGSTVNLPAGAYRAEFELDAPLDGFLPPRSEPFTLGQLTSTRLVTDSFTVASFDPAVPAATTITSRFRSLQGFSAYLLDPTTGHAVSRTATLQEPRLNAYDVYLATVNQQEGAALASDIQFVLAPPVQSIGVPTLRVPIFANNLSSQIYPEVPTPSSVQGVVRDGAGVGVLATVELVATSLINLRDPVPQDQLKYTTRVSTDSLGRFSTIVPEGTYDVFVDPDPALGELARTRASLKTQGATAGPPYNGSVTQWTVIAGPRTTVTGRAVLPDGRPLAGVDVTLLPTLTRFTESAFELPRSPVDGVRTDVNGRFSALLDSGKYDVTVTPTSGTRFAPYVRAEQFVPARAGGTCTLALGDLLVKEPARLSLTLRDTRENPVPYAYARIFARPEGSQRFVELERELLDSSGHVDLLFRKPDPAVPQACE